MPYSPWLWKGKPLKALTSPVRKNGGRSSVHGRIIRRHIGGGHKQRHRKLDFMRLEPGTQDVIRIEYDPKRSAHIALIRSRTGLGPDGGWSYIVAPDGMRAGDEVSSYRTGVPEGLVPKWDEELNEMQKQKVYGGKNGRKLIPAMPIPRPAKVENIRGVDDAWKAEKHARWVEREALKAEAKALEKQKMLEGRIDERYAAIVEEETQAAVSAAEEATRTRQQLENARIGREEENAEFTQRMADTFISAPSSSSSSSFSSSQPSSRQFSSSPPSQSPQLELDPLPPRPSSLLAPIVHHVATGMTPRYLPSNNPHERYAYLPSSIVPPGYSDPSSPAYNATTTALTLNSNAIDPLTGLPATISAAKAASILPSNLRRMHRTNYTTGLGDKTATAGLTILRGIICRPGNVVPIGLIPTGMPIHNISLSPEGRMMLCRAAGTSAEIIGHMAPDVETNIKYSLIKLQSGEVRKVMSEGCATIGQVSKCVVLFLPFPFCLLTLPRWAVLGSKLD
jgi:ribosomal protein L2